MSLRLFHLVFVSLAIVLAAFVAAWAIGQYRLEHETQYVVLAIIAVALGGGLVVYAGAFQRKTKNLG